MHTFKKLAAVVTLIVSACDHEEKFFDASGSFEAIETIISSEVSGKITELNIEEGQLLQDGYLVGVIDSVQLYLKKAQLEVQYNAILSKSPDIAIQLSALESQLATAEKEKLRISNLVKGDAATKKQLDDINASIDVIKTQIAAQKSTLTISREGITNDANAIQIQIQQIEDQLKRSRIINPVSGTVLAKYAQENEITSVGKPIYKIADLSNLILRVYITGDQLSKIKLNQQVKVLTDNGDGGFKETDGIITWINDKAEFTPKTIQTKDERAKMVYAIKINVANDGSYKIGMYGEIKFS
nr:HlyD family efflux transporter periplasmic adaptor subunit [Cytophagales bacterium]